LRIPQLAPFVIKMDQWKVHPIGLIHDLKFDLAICVSKISVIVLNMENGMEACSMLVGRSLLKQASNSS
jgi:high-affinity nickel permease